MKIGFVTCVRLGQACIEAIYDQGAALKLAVTLKDHKARKKSGRIYLDEFCNQHEVPLIKVDHVNDAEAVAAFKDLDWLFIIGWSQIAGPAVLNAPRNGVIGMHPSLLPVGRGRAAIPWAILKGLDQTGVTAFVLDEGVDTGEIIDQEAIPMDSSTTATQLYQDVAAAHIALMRRIIVQMRDGSIASRAQDESQATIWPGRGPEDGRIDLNGSVADADRLVRAVTRPYPGAFYVDQSDERWTVWEARVESTQPEGAYLEFADGYLALLEAERRLD